MFNAAMVTPSDNTLTYPVLSVEGFTVRSGSGLTMENQNSTYSPADDQVWSWIQIAAPASSAGSDGSGSAGTGSSSGTSSSCLGVQCLVDSNSMTIQEWWAAVVAALS